jgi:pimeloyl-ACP methyl ester carboxylesterase
MPIAPADRAKNSNIATAMLKWRPAPDMAFCENHFYGLNSKGFHRIVYNDWGDPDGQPIIGVHGLTGNGHDFDFIAADLVKQGYRVIAVDLAGRGRSDFLPYAMDYNYNQYTQDLTALLAHLCLSEPGSVDWLGISLGGLLGIKMAGLPNTPIRRLILNDVGPEVPKPALDFIHMVIAQPYYFENIAAIEKRMRETRGLSWGPVTDEQWKHMAEHNARGLEDGTLTYGYDPRIAEIFKTQPTGDADLWPYWKDIKAPVLVLHGGQSMVLTQDIINQMSADYKGHSMTVARFDDCGHVPSLMHPPQIDVVQTWLNDTPIS